MKKNAKSENISFRPSEDHAARLDRLIRATGHKKTFFLDSALAAVLPALELEYKDRLRRLDSPGAGGNPALNETANSTVPPGTAARIVDTVQAQADALKYKLHRKRK